MKPKEFYKYLKPLEPTIYDRLTNKAGQEILLVEHPEKGEDYPVIAMCDELELASDTGFFDTGDMTDGLDYEPSFVDGDLYIGDMKHD